MGRARTFDDQDILERATRLFWRNGYNGTSMRQLVDITGLAKASLYNAFGNKQDIFHSVLKYYIDTKQTQSLALLAQGRTGRQALEAYFANIVRVTAQNSPTPGCLLVNTAAEQGPHQASMRDIVDRGIKRTERHLANTVQRGIEDGSINPGADPELAGFCLTTMLLGIRVLARKGVDIEKVRSLIKANLDAHAPGIVKQHS